MKLYLILVKIIILIVLVFLVTFQWSYTTILVNVYNTKASGLSQGEVMAMLTAVESYYQGYGIPVIFDFYYFFIKEETTTGHKINIVDVNSKDYLREIRRNPQIKVNGIKVPVFSREGEGINIYFLYSLSSNIVGLSNPRTNTIGIASSYIERYGLEGMALAVSHEFGHQFNLKHNPLYWSTNLMYCFEDRRTAVEMYPIQLSRVIRSIRREW